MDWFHHKKSVKDLIKHLKNYGNFKAKDLKDRNDELCALQSTMSSSTHERLFDHPFFLKFQEYVKPLLEKNDSKLLVQLNTNRHNAAKRIFNHFHYDCKVVSRDKTHTARGFTSFIAGEASITSNFKDLVAKDPCMKIYSACKNVASNRPLEERFAKAVINCHQEGKLLKQKKRSSDGLLKEP